MLSQGTYFPVKVVHGGQEKPHPSVNNKLI